MYREDSDCAILLQELNSRSFSAISYLDNGDSLTNAVRKASILTLFNGSLSPQYFPSEYTSATPRNVLQQLATLKAPCTETLYSLFIETLFSLVNLLASFVPSITWSLQLNNVLHLVCNPQACHPVLITEITNAVEKLGSLSALVKQIEIWRPGPIEQTRISLLLETFPSRATIEVLAQVVFLAELHQ
jgi:hypothetical protein